MKRRRLAGLAAAAAAAAALAWVLWPERAARTVSITDRAARGVAEAEPDLPPPGTRSLFDHLLAQSDGLPYPFEALVAQITALAPDAPPVVLAIPDGRSLLKAQADFAHPRVLVAADFHGAHTPASLGVNGRGQLFLGFVENAREIEVISYNEAAGRYEFQLVQDYAADGARRIVYARRAICTTCHQGGTPIFPQRPWNETNAQPDIAERIRAARGDAPYLQVPAQVPLSAPERFDELTDVAAFTMAAQAVWQRGCGAGKDGRDCRRQLLLVALAYAEDPGRFDPASAAATRLRALQAAQWPDAVIAVPESDLRNRDPLAHTRSAMARLRSLLTPRPPAGAGARNNEDLVAFERLPPLPAELDPLTPRPPRRVLTADALDGAWGIAAQFSAQDIDRLWRALDRAPSASVAALPDALFDAAPFSRVRTLQALLATAQQTADYCCLDTSALSAPVAATAPPLALVAGSPLQPFADYCFACHRGNPAARLDFMAGDDEAQVSARIRATPAIRDALDWERYAGTERASLLMPPADSPQRAQMQAALARDPELLARMRAQVPGLFDF